MLKALIVIAILVLAPIAWAEDTSETPPEPESKTSKWFAAPLVSSDPKISTAAGAMAGYMYEFDKLHHNRGK